MEYEENPRRGRKRKNPGKKKRKAGKRRSRKRSAVTVVRINPRRRARRNPSRRMRARRNPSRRRSFRRNPAGASFGQLGKAVIGGSLVRGADMLVQKTALTATKMRLARFAAGAAVSIGAAYAGAPNLALGAAGATGYMGVDLVQQEYAYRKALSENKTPQQTTTPAAGQTGFGSVRQIAQQHAMRQGFGSIRNVAGRPR